MAMYQNNSLILHVKRPEFDGVLTPGTIVEHSGIYRCQGCTREIAANKGDPLPPQSHHQHQPSQGYIRWQLVVSCETEPRQPNV